MEYSDNVTILKDGERTFYIIGTAHISAESVAEVEQVIEAVRPDTVCVELCQTRFNALTDEKRWQKLDIFKVIKEGKTLFLLANLAISAYQRRLGAELGVKPGAEMLAAIKKADEYGAKVELVDREIAVTLKRTWRNVGFFKKFALLGAILEGMVRRKGVGTEEIENLKQQANLSEMLNEFARVMPEVKKSLIDERDKYLMSSIEDAPGKKIVAVVGAGHVSGMKEVFGKPVDRKILDQLPPKRRYLSLLKWLIPALLVAAFFVGYSKHEGESVGEMLKAWILPNSIFCAVLTAAAGGKLLSIVIAFCASPITSLNPLLGAGLVVGLAEAWFRKPTVADCERINDDVQSIRGIYKNPFTRVLLVAVAATIGSAMGAWIGLAWVSWIVAA